MIDTRKCREDIAKIVRNTRQDRFIPMSAEELYCLLDEIDRLRQELALIKSGMESDDEWLHKNWFKSE